MPRTIVTKSPVSEGVSRRFFLSIATLVNAGQVNSLESFCNANKLSPPRYRAMRLEYGTNPKPGYVSAYKNVEIEAVYAIVANFPVSADWLITGRGEMLTRKLKAPTK